MLEKLKIYYFITKPGIVRGNILATAGGFFLAARGTIDTSLLIATLGGTSLIIASACVLNNYLDRSIDSKMARTKHRAIVSGAISVRNALTYAAILGVLGFVVLGLYTNILTVLVGMIGLVFYVLIYGYAKRTTHHGTLIGSISGSTPPVAGYVAVTNSFDMAAVLLFVILAIWQMPHFYAIALFRMKEYAAANIPVLPLRKSIARTKREIILYIIAFMVVSPQLTVYGYTGMVYAFAMTGLGTFWLSTAILGRNDADIDQWAKRIFGISLVVLLVFSVLLAFNVLLP